MSFSRLATIELQLTMHFCDTASLLALAFCSRATHAAASSAFAWRHSPPVVVSALAAQGGPLTAQLPRVMQARDIELRCDAAVKRAQVAAVTRLRVLDARRGCNLLASSRLFTLPALQGLLELRVSRSFPPRLMQSMLRLPHLHTLECIGWSPFERRYAFAGAATAAGSRSPCVHLLWPPLRRLMLHQIDSTDYFHALCHEPGLAGLQLLHLHTVSEYANSFCAALCQLRHLQTLSIGQACIPAFLHPELSSLPALRELRVVCAAQSPYRPSGKPLAWPLAAVLDAAPRLRVYLECPSTLLEWLLIARSSTRSDKWNLEKHMDQWRHLQQLAAVDQRVTLMDRTALTDTETARRADISAQLAVVRSALATSTGDRVTIACSTLHALRLAGLHERRSRWMWGHIIVRLIDVDLNATDGAESTVHTQITRPVEHS